LIEVDLMRILLADPQPKVRFALRVLLERHPDFQVVGEAACAEELLVLAAASCPDLVLLDWSVAGAVAEGLMIALRTECPGAGVIVLSGRPEAREAALGAGADTFVSKGHPPEYLLAAIIRCCGSGQTARTRKLLAEEDIPAVSR
jgi:two-component system nitrate/nitrite response regulator NarL